MKSRTKTFKMMEQARKWASQFPDRADKLFLLTPKGIKVKVYFA